MRKRLTAVFMCLCMMLTLLPAPAYAAVRELVGNPAEENQALLEELEALTGQDGEAVLELLEAYGLLDEDGNLITDQTVILNGAEYTLEEIEAMLDDPATDLSEVGYVGDTPIALGDLKTIIAIERELQRIEELYFSGTPFEGESLDNFNDLLDQVQASGITLNAPQILAAGSGTRVASVSGINTLSLGGSGTANIEAKAGDTLSVDVTYDPGILAADSVTVSLGSSTATLTSAATQTLSYTVPSDETVELTVTVSSGNSPTDYVYGELTGAVQLTNPQGFVFQSGSNYYPAHTVLLSENRAVPVMYTAVGGYGTAYTLTNVNATDKLEMRGENITVENIGKTVTDGFERVSNNISDYVKSGQPRTFLQKAADLFVVIIGFLLKFIIVLAGIVLLPPLAFVVFILIVVLFALITGGAGILYHLSPFGMDLYNGVPTPMVIMGCLGTILLIGIPVFSLAYAICAHLFKWSPLSTPVKWVLIVLWIISLILCGIYVNHTGMLWDWQNYWQGNHYWNNNFIWTP